MRIMPLGDSLTSGVTSGTTVEGAYRNKLYSLLTTAGYNVDFVGTQTDATNPTLPDKDHQGMGGYRIDQLQAGLPSWLNVIEDPDVVLLMIGTNDFSQNFNIATAQARLSSLVTDVATRRPFAKIILSNLPLRTDSATFEAQQSAFNASIPGIVSDQVALGRQVTFLDMHSALLATDLSEGVHPTAAGYDKMANAWFPAITGVIAPLGTTNPPAIVRTEPPVDLQHLAVRFSKPLADSSTALANFSLNGGLSISQAVLDPVTKRTITLTTSAQTAGKLYTLTVSGVRDRTAAQTLIAPGSTVNYSSFTLANGSFEAGETGWTMTGNRLNYGSDGTYVATNGTKMMVLNGGNTTPNAIITQTFATVPGQYYVLNFDVGILAVNAATQQLGVSVTGASTLVAQMEVLTGNSLGNSVWTGKSYAFVADSASAILAFQDQSSSSNGIDLLLDNVRITATLPPQNTAPVAVADSYATTQNLALSIVAAGVLTNDTDAESNALTAVLNSNPSHGTLALNANGSFTYTPTTGYSGADSFTYHANDGSLNSNVVTASIAVNPVAVGSLINGSFESGEAGWAMTGNRLVYQSDGTYVATDPLPTVTAYMLVLNGGPAVPNAVIKQDFATTPGQSYNLSFDIGVIAINAAEQKLNVTVTGAGTLLNQTESVFGNSVGNSVWASRSYSFVAAGNLTTLAFSDISPATSGIDMLLDNVKITTSAPVNTAPVAVADSYSTNQGVALVVPASGVLSNDTDAQSNPLTAILNVGPAHGSLTLNASGGFTYTPTTGYSGADSFTYHANDGSLNSNVVTVGITVNVVNTAPVAVADSYSTNQGVALVVAAAGVLANDTDAQSNPLTAIVNVGPAHGSLTLNSNGGFTYTPTAGYAGPDSFTYHANDGSLNSNIATVSITVNVVNTAPVAVADSYSTNQGVALVVAAAGVLANDTDAQSNPLTAIINVGPAHGSLTLSSNGSFTYTPTTGYSGADSFTYHANDGSLNSNIATVSITVNLVNTAPVAVADSYSTNQNTALVVPAAGVLANDTDAQSNPLTAIANVGPAHGSLALNSNGGFTYTPTTGYSGADSFTYHANDGSLNSNIATVSITVSAPVSQILVNGSFESNYIGWTNSGNQAIETYQATDGIKKVAFNSRNLAPNAVLSQTFGTVSGKTYTLAFDTGVLSYVGKQQKLAVTVTGTNSRLSQTVTLTGASDGSVSWTAKSYTFVANSATTVLSFQDLSSFTDGIDLLLDNVRVTGPPAVPTVAPVAVADSYSVNKNTALVVPATGVLANDTDPQGNPLTALLDGSPSHGTLNFSTGGGFTYTPVTGYIGADSFTYHASNGGLNSGIVAVNITVNEVTGGILVNSSFESDFTGWTATGNLSIGYYPATDGIKLVSFNGDNRTPNGVLSQAFATTPGQIYSLAFDASVLAYTTDSQILQITVAGTGNLLSQSVTINGLGTGLGPWQAQNFTFMANSTTTTVTFRDQSVATVGIDLLLDYVRVVAIAAPAPAPAPAAALQLATTPGATPVLTLTSTPEAFIIRMTAPQDGIYLLERSEDLQNWQQLDSMRCDAQHLVEFYDNRGVLGSETPRKQAFYRIGLPASN
ncbi:MAG: Ig-like domain-containing protein [Luteolibacter sp.]|uniref:Ig-like domain-containing protein n=1 Tax=Luteolibacter sp. TaxID=1962973 RepID=UPI0032642393